MWALHIRYHQQEETLKISKFGWLAALVAVAAVFGAVAYTPGTAQAAPTGAAKTCTGTGAGTNCTLTFSDDDLHDRPLRPGDVQFGDAVGDDGRLHGDRHDHGRLPVGDLDRQQR
jgi:hypothetical protein